MEAIMTSLTTLTPLQCSITKWTIESQYRLHWTQTHPLPFRVQLGAIRPQGLWQVMVTTFVHSYFLSKGWISKEVAPTDTAASETWSLVFPLKLHPYDQLRCPCGQNLAIIVKPFGLGLRVPNHRSQPSQGQRWLLNDFTSNPAPEVGMFEPSTIGICPSSICVPVLDNMESVPIP